MKKIYVLDTNVLVHDPDSIFKFDDNDLVIPIAVIEELDKLKKGNDEVARNSRRAIRNLDELRSLGDFVQGVPMEGGGILTIELNHQDQMLLTGDLPLKNNDNRILCVAKSLSNDYKSSKALKRNKGAQVILVSKDANVRVKADALGVAVQDFKNDKVDVSSLFNGFCDPELLVANSFYEAHDGTLMRVFGSRGRNVKEEATVLTLRTKNKEQACAVDLLRQRDLPLIALVGQAGTGKTLLAIAAGVEQVRQGKFERLVITRPVVPIGKDLGALPGDLGEKMDPWMEAIWDALDFLGIRKDGNGQGKGAGKVHIEIQPLQYIRGRSIPKAFMIVDEAQNLTPHEIKTIVTRAGEGSKIVVTGDIWQIDHPYLDSESSGLSYLVGRFKGDEDFGTVTLTEGVRSRLAEKAGRLL